MEGFSIMEFKLLASQTGDIFNKSFLINQPLGQVLPTWLSKKYFGKKCCNKNLRAICRVKMELMGFIFSQVLQHWCAICRVEVELHNGSISSQLNPLVTKVRSKKYFGSQRCNKNLRAIFRVEMRRTVPLGFTKM